MEVEEVGGGMITDRCSLFVVCCSLLIEAQRWLDMASRIDIFPFVNSRAGGFTAFWLYLGADKKCFLFIF